MALQQVLLWCAQRSVSQAQLKLASGMDPLNPGALQQVLLWRPGLVFAVLVKFAPCNKYYFCARSPMADQIHSAQVFALTFHCPSEGPIKPHW